MHASETPAFGHATGTYLSVSALGRPAASDWSLLGGLQTAKAAAETGGGIFLTWPTLLPRKS